MVKIQGTLVFCINCQELIQKEHASSVFKSGFYKVIYPLAQCIKCTSTK